MSWVKRGLWVATWGVWLWLGFGLYRELPRDYGPTTAKLNLGDRIPTLGFIGSSNHAAFVVPEGPKATTIHVIDGETGAEVRRISGPIMHDYLLWEERYPRSHGVMLSSYSPVKGGVDGTAGLHLLDLVRGEWTRISDREVKGARLHPTKPWAVLVDGSDGKNRQWKATVIDYKSGRRVVVRDGLSAFTPANLAFFLPNPDRLVVPLRAQPPIAGHEVDFEVWNIETTPKLERTIPAPGFTEQFIVSDDGRIAWTDCIQPLSVDVFDFNEGRLIFAHPPKHERKPNSSTMIRPQLSGSGRTVLAGNPIALWDVDSGRAIRTGNAVEGFAHQGDDRRCTTSEAWWRLWPKWSKQLPLRSLTYRSMDDGFLIYRTTERNSLFPAWWNAAGTLAIDPNDKRIVSVPPRVNYPLLTLCQTILALPLILLWAILRWHRNRRLRLARVTP